MWFFEQILHRQNTCIVMDLALWFSTQGDLGWKKLNFLACLAKSQSTNLRKSLLIVTINTNTKKKLRILIGSPRSFEDHKKFKFFYDPKQDGLLFPVLELRHLIYQGKDVFFVYYLGRQDPDTLRYDLMTVEDVAEGNEILWEK